MLLQLRAQRLDSGVCRCCSLRLELLPSLQLLPPQPCSAAVTQRTPQPPSVPEVQLPGTPTARCAGLHAIQSCPSVLPVLCGAGASPALLCPTCHGAAAEASSGVCT